MTTLPEPELHLPAAPSEADRAEAARLLAAIDEIPTAHRDTSPLPQYGPTPPVPQPGRPPMSQKAVDASGVMLAGSVASVPLGGMTCLVLYTLDQVDPVSLAIGATAPVALVLALARLLRGARPEPEVHQHYTGPVTQHTTRTETRGVWAKTINRT